MGQTCVEVPGGEAKDTRVGWRSRGPSPHRGGGAAGKGRVLRGMEECGQCADGGGLKKGGGLGAVARGVDEREANTLLQEYVKKFERLTGGDAVVGGGGGGVVTG